MKRVFVALLITVLSPLAWAAELGFIQSLPAEDIRAAGLGRLTPGELAHLDALVAAYKAGLAVQAQQKAEAALAAQRAAEALAKAAQEDANRVKAEAKAAAAESKASDRGFLARAKVLIVPGTQIEYAEISSTIEGAFEGWSGRTVFHLANGQRWQVANSDERYFVPPEQNVAVQIRTAALGGYWMYFPTFEKRVRVKLFAK